jgi:hypothetical protein
MRGFSGVDGWGVGRPVHQRRSDVREEFVKINATNCSTALRRFGEPSRDVS